MVLRRLVVGNFATNCYIVGDDESKEGMVIDPGGSAKLILGTIKETGLNIKIIVLTHTHVDHIVSLREIKEATGAAVGVHPDEARYLSRSPLNLIFTHSLSGPPHADRLLKGGDSIDIGALHFLVLHTPGHSPGGLCLYGHGMVFSGDAIFNCGIGRTDMPGGSEVQLLNAIHTKLMVLPDNTMVYPGHGPETTIGAERRGNPFLRG